MSEAIVKELVSEWLLLTYDIPANEKALRRKFLKEAHAMGAEMHTDSVYLMPYSQQALDLASGLNSAGHAVVWQAHQPNKVKASEMTMKYGAAIIARCNNIEQRLDIAQDYIAAGRLEMSNKMAHKTLALLQQVAKIAENYDPGWLVPRLEELATKWKEIYGGGE